jgi:hypothetical protein
VRRGLFAIDCSSESSTILRLAAWKPGGGIFAWLLCLQHVQCALQLQI